MKMSSIILLLMADDCDSVLEQEGYLHKRHYNDIPAVRLRHKMLMPKDLDL
jgi:hypothetical protein